MESSNQPSPVNKGLRGKVEIDIQKCKGCELCITACHPKALHLDTAINAKGYRYAVADNSLCTGCVNCALVCPDAVITVFRARTIKKTAPLARPALLHETQAAL